jgi:hypothetical protein
MRQAWPVLMAAPAGASTSSDRVLHARVMPPVAITPQAASGSVAGSIPSRRRSHAFGSRLAMGVASSSSRIASCVYRISRMPRSWAAWRRSPASGSSDTTRTPSGSAATVCIVARPTSRQQYTRSDLCCLVAARAATSPDDCGACTDQPASWRYRWQFCWNVLAEHVAGQARDRKRSRRTARSVATAPSTRPTPSAEAAIAWVRTHGRAASTQPKCQALTSMSAAAMLAKNLIV